MSCRVTQKSLISLFIKAWMLMLSYQLLKGSLTCLVLANLKEQNLKENDRFTKDGFVETMYGEDTSVVESNRSSHSCKYYKLVKRLICNRFIDYAYLKRIRNEEINEFVVGSYDADSWYQRKYWSPDEIKTGERYLKLPKVHQLLKGEICLEDSWLHIEFNMRMLPKMDSKGFRLEGEAFSNKFIRISWRLEGNLTLDFLRDKAMVSLDVGVIGASDWKLQSNFTFVTNGGNNSDLWEAESIIKSDLSLQNTMFYRGIFVTNLEKEQCKFEGFVRERKENLEATVSGSISKKPERKHNRIPKSAFSNMTIKSIVFKDSIFYNDFDENSFEGLRGVKRISFTGSKLELFPRLDELFHYFSDLQEIYIEDCTLLQLTFGVMSTLKNVRRLSFKGSGPLNFDEFSFEWLIDSRLEFLNLRGSNIKISFETGAVLRSVSKTLKHLDVSHSTLKGETELNLTLRDLKIVTLKAEGLNLNKIPISALANVRKTLTYLSLRENDFRKNFQEDMFNSILTFPLMDNLTELNLEACHINYIEKGMFDSLPNLKILHLGYNKLENIQNGWIYDAPKVTYLSLAHSDYTSQPPFALYNEGTSMNWSKFTNLEILDLSHGKFREVHKILSGLGDSLRNLSLRNTRLDDLPDNFFHNLSALEVLDLSYNRNMRGEEPFSFVLFKNLKKLKSLNLKYCKITATTDYHSKLVESFGSDGFTLENLEYLDLSENNLKMFDYKILKVFPNLKVLNLSGNSITEWRTSVLSNEHLETLFLDENKIETITDEMFADIRRLKQVKLGHNPFNCGLYVYQIIKMIEASNGQYEVNNKNTLNETEVQKANVTNKFLQKNNNSNQFSSNRHVKFLDWFGNNYICYSRSQAKFMLFTQVNEKFQDFLPKQTENVEVTFILWTGIVVLGIAISIALICWKFLDIHLITGAVRNAVALSFIGRNEKGVTNFKYNVFVSYSDKDRSWVIENLLPRLESRCEEESVCLHERDFQVGLSIIENILNSIESSRNIILVVSQAFLKSQWCQYEMQLAQFRLLEKGRHQLILIFLENIPAIKRPKTLKYLMMTKTYLEWPLNSTNHRDVDIFWNRLMRSLENKN